MRKHQGTATPILLKRVVGSAQISMNEMREVAKKTANAFVGAARARHAFPTELLRDR